MAKKPKFYVVWLGHEPGVYTTWPQAKKQVDGYKGAKYKSFPSRSQAEAAYQGGFHSYLSKAIAANSKTGHPRPRKTSSRKSNAPAHPPPLSVTVFPWTPPAPATPERWNTKG